MNNLITGKPCKYYKHGLPIKFRAMDDLPSCKLLMKVTISLSDTELISLIIWAGIQGENSINIAKQLILAANNSLATLWGFNVNDLIKMNGIRQIKSSDVERRPYHCPQNDNQLSYRSS